MRVTKTSNRQRGAIDLVLLLAIFAFGIIVISGIKVAPLYIDHWALKDIVEGVQEEASQTGPVNARKLEGMITRRLDVNRLQFLESEDMEIVREADGYLIDISYERRVSFFFNIDVVVKFDNLQGEVASSGE
jgi:hypothetical protein